MSEWNLPPGVTSAMIDAQFGEDMPLCDECGHEWQDHEIDDDGNAGACYARGCECKSYRAREPEHGRGAPSEFYD